jgi:ubiquinone/menaquinone biosynthesis C-methylase UbiE
VSGPSFGPEFSDLDGARRPDELLGFLDRAATVPEIQDAKRRATEALGLASGERVLDAGCGTGVDLIDMLAPTLPGGAVVGIDRSERAVKAARARVAGQQGVSVEVADAHALPFESGEFDAVRMDRTLLHLEDPDRGLSELRRVLTRSGRLVVLEMSTVLDAPEELIQHPVHRAISERFWNQAQQRGRIELFVPLLLSRTGFRIAGAETGTADIFDPEPADALLRLTPALRDAAADGAVSEDDADAWLSLVREGMAAERVAARVSFVRFLAVSAPVGRSARGGGPG